MIKLSIIEDNSLFKNLLENFIELQVDIELLSSHDSIESFLHSHEQMVDEPEILVLDIELSARTGLDALPTILAKHPTVELIIYSHQLTEDVILEALSNGAFYYASKLDSMHRLLELVRMIHNGRTQIQSSWARKMLRTIYKESQYFSAQDLQLLNDLSVGTSYSQIASELNCSVASIETNSKNILSQLHRFQHK